MAKRKYKKSSSKCPEPINTLIDIAAGLTMGAVANHMEKKYHYKKKGKINPYSVSAFGLSTGKMKSTEDILRTGAFLGAMGSFDVEAEDERGHSYIPADPVFSEIKTPKHNNNRYAWRLNCEDGLQYGIRPEDFETREAYSEALRRAKESSSERYASETQTQEDYSSDTYGDEKCHEQAVDDDKIYTFCKVTLNDGREPQYFLSDDVNIQIGSIVRVPHQGGSISGVVVAVERFSAALAPTPPEYTPHIICDS